MHCCLQTQKARLQKFTLTSYIQSKQNLAGLKQKFLHKVVVATVI